MVVGEVKERLYISEPGGAFAVECDCAKTLRSLLTNLLTISSLLMSGSNNVANAAHYLQKQIGKLNEKIVSLMRSLTALQPECELARDLDEELEMAHLRIFALKYRLAAICDVPFPPPSELLSKVSLRTLRHLSSFGGAAVCSLHLHFLCKARFQIGKRNSSSREELALNVLALHTELMQHAKVSVVLPSGTVLNINEPADNTKAILEKVCDELCLCPEKYCIVREGRHRVRLMECEYRIEKTDRSLGLTICARQVDDVIKAEVRAVRDGTTMVQVGDTVVSVDEHPISELQTADQVETLLRSATALVLRRRNCSHSCGSSFIVNDSRLPVANKTHSMDRISEPTSSNTLNNEWQAESTRSSPSRRSCLKQVSANVMSHSACERSSREDDRKPSPTSLSLKTSHFSPGAEEQLFKTINELVTTEENFVRDVQKLVSQYLKPLNLPILETADRLLRVQTSFLCSLLDAAGDVAHSASASQQQLRDSLIRISALFVNKCSKFKIYSEYSAAYLRFQQNKKEKNDIEAKLEKMNVSGEQSESAQSLLIKPIQRVLKYPLFLQQMRDNCARGSVERQQGEQALSRMHALAEYVNEMQRLTEQYGLAIEEISSKNSAVSRMNFSQLLMFAHVNWLNCYENRSRPVSCVAFVFTSLILILCPSLSKSKARVYRILPIAEIEVNESDGNSTQSQFLFVLIHIGSPREPVYHLCCCQAEVKNQFIKSIRKAAASLAKEQRRPLSGSSQSDGGYGSERHPP
uniref:DH domain-containing protein n=1 Tax=Ascaris lumbricoides TaxID=6252 RepID=A0A0M3I0W5_ASCLU